MNYTNKPINQPTTVAATDQDGLAGTASSGSAGGGGGGEAAMDRTCQMVMTHGCSLEMSDMDNPMFDMFDLFDMFDICGYLDIWIYG